MTRILHISGDFPDAHSARKTKAVKNLVAGSPEFDHRIYSINRRYGLGGIREVAAMDDARDGTGPVTTLIYRAPPYAVLLESFLNPLADRIARDVRAAGDRIDLIHAHKLTIEGLVAHRLARALDCPYICTVRGNTDQKYLRLKPEKRTAFRRVAAGAAHLLPVTPWIDRYLTARLGLGAEPPRTLLPTITGIDRILPPAEGSRFATVFHLDFWRMKGMPNLLAALRRLKDGGTGIGLDIIGGGSPAAVAGLTRAIEKHGLQDQVALTGAVPHDDMQDRLNGYAGFVLPTLRETFGMVYIEALFSGVPILYSQDRGIDGFFEDGTVGVRCDPASVDSIARGLTALLQRGAEMKDTIAGLQQAGGFDRFRTQEICAAYAGAVRTATGTAPSRPAPRSRNAT